MKKIILASTSPRRQELLEGIGLIFETMSPDFDENIIGLTFSYAAIEEIALNKARSVFNNTEEPALIISADTVVVVDNDVLGKPSDSKAAFAMLKRLNNNTHKVVTSIALMDTETKMEKIESTTSFVTFNNLSDETLISYIDNFSPLDKAGAYGIQELPDGFIQKVEGEYDNIVGLPTKTLIKMMTSVLN